MPALDDLNLLSPESFHIFFELSDSAVAVLNRAGLVNYCNSKSLQLWKDPNLQGKTILEFLSTENAQTLLRIIYSVLGTRQSVSDEISAVVQGRALILHFSIHALSGAAELSEQVVFSATDITKNKQRDQALQQFRLIADNTHDIVLLVDQVSGQILDANMAALSAYGYTYEEVLGLKILDLRKDSPELVRLQMAEASHKGLLFEAVHYRKNGSSFPVEVSTQSAMINGKATLISIIRDISERRNLHRQLIESEEKFAKAFDTNPLPMAITDLECSVYLDVNMAFVNRLGYSFGEVVGHTAAELNLFADLEKRSEALKIMNRDGRIERFEVPVRTRTGEIRQGLFSGELMEVNGRRLLLTVMEDITLQKQAEQALLDSRQNIQVLIENSDAAIWSVDCDCNLIVANNIFQRMAHNILGRMLEPGENVLNILMQLPEQQKWDEFYRRSLAGETLHLELPHVFGVIERVVDYNFKPLYNLSGDVMGVTIFGKDITEQIEIHRQLAKSEEKFSKAFRTNPLLMMIVDPETDYFVDVNESFMQVSGYTYLEAIGHSPVELGIVLDEQKRQATHKRLEEEGSLRNIEQTLRTRQGEERQGLFSYEILEVQGRRLILVAMQDVTEQRRMEEEVRKSEAHFRALTEKSPTVVVLLNANYQIIYSTPNAKSVLGYTADERIGQSAFSLIYQDDLPKIRTALQRVFEQPGTSAHGEFRGNHRDGSLRWLEGSATNLLDDPNIGGIVINFNDISERFSARQALEESEARYRKIFEGAQEGLIVMEIASKVFVYVNQAMCVLFGYTQAEFGQLSVADLHPEWEQQHVSNEVEWMSRVEQSAATGIACKRKDGSVFYADISASQVEIHAQKHLVGFFNDVSERRRNEQLQRARLWLEKLPRETLLEEVLQETLDQAEMITESTIGFFHFIEENQNTIWLQNWSTNTIANMCTAEGKGSHYPVDQAGVWADSLRSRRTVIYNDYSSLPNQRGMPDGHAPISRFISVPVERDGLIVALIGIGNKAIDYTEQDVEVVELLANEAWDIISRRQTELALLESEAKYRTLVESHDSMIATVDAEGVVHFMNKNAAASINRSPEEVIGMNLFALFDQPIAERYLAEILMVIASGKGVTQEEEATIHGQAVWWRTNIEPIFDAAHQVHLAMVHSVDITLRKETERVLEEMVKVRTAEIEAIRQRLEMATQAAGIGIWEWNLKTDALIWDDQMLALYDVRAENFVGTNDVWKQRLHPEDEPERNRPIEEFFQHGKSDARFRVIWPDQSIHHIRSTSVLLYDENNQPRQVVGIDYDITSQVQAERVLRSSEEMLRRANTELERAIRMKDEFLASMSHELRTPLTGILGLSEALQMEIYGGLSDRQRNALELIESSGRHLLELITDILDVSKVEAGKLDLQIETGSLGDICQSSIQLVKGMLQKKRQHLQFSMDPAFINISGDMRRIKQILVNLLSNAIKFTPETGEVGLEVCATEKDHCVRLTVWDRGIGISEEDLPRLFQPFVQLDSGLSRQYAGTGLGLTLVKRLVEMHQGRVEVESSPGKGSRFHVYLPWVGRENNEKFKSFKGSPLVENLAHLSHVLTVEDNPEDNINLQSYCFILGLGQKNLLHGQGLVEHILAYKPDLVVIDNDLPGKSGWDVLSDLRGNRLTRHLPVVMTSNIDQRSRAELLGADGFLVKPYTLAEFSGALQVASSTAEQRRAQNAQPPPAGLIPPKQPLVLVVEDNQTVSIIVSDALQAGGYDVASAANGFDCIEILPKVRPNLILMDIQMPGIDGLEVIRLLRALPDLELARLPVIALTALAMPGDRERCLQAGATDYMAKPLHLPELLAAVNKLLSAD